MGQRVGQHAGHLAWHSQSAPLTFQQIQPPGQNVQLSMLNFLPYDLSVQEAVETVAQDDKDKDADTEVGPTLIR